jgi:hypothetical protein
MALRVARDALSRIFYQRCFYLFAMLLALIAAAPLVPESIEGRFITNSINAFVVVATVAAVGRSMLSFVIVILLAAPTLGFQWIGLAGDNARWLAYSWSFGSALYLVATVYLLRYVFRPEVMTADKLFGAAASYLMLGILWAYFYRLLGYVVPNSFVVGGQPASLDFYESIYFSMTVLTSTGFGDITPLTRQARSVCIVEQIAGALFVAILIARLAGVYPPRRREPDTEN